MPRIVPIQLLKCLKVLLNVNGGILSTGEVRRIAQLMSKYSKKLVSKCIYVQILKCTDTELLDEFMSVGGWNLVHGWLADGIRLLNWPLVQEILELLLLCPVDVNRLKINSAPKMVKSLCAASNEGVCILAKRLVDQWLKIVTEGNEAQQQPQNSTIKQNDTQSESVQSNFMLSVTPKTEPLSEDSPVHGLVPKMEHSNNDEVNDKKIGNIDEDPLALPDETSVSKNLKPTVAQKKASKAGLVYKIVVRNGQQLLTKVDSKTVNNTEDSPDGTTGDLDESDAIVEEEETEDAASEFVEEDSTSLDKTDDKESSESSIDKKFIVNKEKERTESKEQRERRKSKDGKSKDYKSEKDKERRSSSSHRTSSSSHKSSSRSSTSSSSSSKSKSSSPTHRSSSDKYRSSSSSSSSKDKDKERSSSSKHKSSSSSSSKTSSSSSSSKERHREKDKDKTISTSSLSSKKDKEREKELQSEKDKDTLAKMLPPSLDKLGKIPKKPKDDKSEKSENSSINKPTSITIPSKKASMSIEIRRDTEKTNTVKTYKSQFRSHGLTEEAPPPPSRKTLKKPSSSTSQPGTVIPATLPSSLKRSSPPPRESPNEKKSKIDINQITPAAANIEKPGAIKLIPAKRIQTLVETNIFSDALSAATGPKKVTKRKRPAQKDEPTTPTSPDAPKVAPLKFYQDTLDESAKATNEESDKSKDAESNNINSSSNADAEKDADEDDDIPLKKVKEDIEQRVRKEKAAAASGESIDITSDADDEGKEKSSENDIPEVEQVRKPGPGCGPDGPPGVLMLHRRKGPKKKLTWRPQEQLEQIRYFELDENERVNVMKVSFHDMKNMERFNERTSLTNMTKRGPKPGDNQEPRTEWRPLYEVDEVPVHPDGAQSKERRVQADREMTTLRALYFSPNMIPDSPSEAEIEPHYPGDPPTIPLDDITGNQDTINDFSGMPWPEPKGSPKHGDNAMSGTGGLGGLGNPAADMFSNVLPNNPTNMKSPFSNNNNFMGPFGVNANSIGPNNMPAEGPQQMTIPQNGWQGPPKNTQVPLINNAFSFHPNADMMQGGPNFIQSHGQFNGPPPFMQGRNGPFGPPSAFNGPNFNQVGPGNNMGPMSNNMGPMSNNMGPMSNNMGPMCNNIGPMANNMGPMGNNMGPSPLMNAMNNNGPRGGRNNNNWMNGPNNFQDNNNMNKGNWRPAGSGPNRTGPNNMGGNNGVCKAYMRGNCRVSKCKYIHPKKRL